jgi:hypothetical protein
MSLSISCVLVKISSVLRVKERISSGRSSHDVSSRIKSTGIATPSGDDEPVGADESFLFESMGGVGGGADILEVGT